MDLGQRGLTLAAALLLVGGCGALSGVVASSGAWASADTVAARPRPSPTATPTPPPTPRPTPTPTPKPTPPPTPPPTATPAPTPEPSVAPTSAPVPQPAGADEVAGLPFASQAPVTGSAQAVAIAPTLRAATNAADTGAPGDTQNLFLLSTVVIMAIPALLTMTLLATVLTRR